MINKIIKKVKDHRESRILKRQRKIAKENEGLSKEEILAKSIDKMNKNLSKYTSFRMVFYRGLIQGLGTVIGATILTGIVLGILISILNTVDFQSVPFIQNFIDDIKASTDIDSK